VATLNTTGGAKVAAIKRVLVPVYSQTGQLAEITRCMIEPLQADPRISVHVELLRPVAPYPFPWSFFQFLDAFPESAHMVPPALQPLSLNGNEEFDLVIMPYQVWFLAPSLPVTAFLKHPVAARLLAGRPVVTVIACRNMWMLAHEKLKKMLGARSARLTDNVVYVDPSPTMASLVTTPLWMLTGKRNFFKALPPAGVRAQDIAGAVRFGRALRDALLAGEEQGPGPLLAGLKAVNSDPHLLFSERAATRSFFVWGKLVRLAGEPGQLRRRPVLLLYAVFLVTLVLTVVPLSLVVQMLLRPFLRKRFAVLKQQFDAPSGSGVERMFQYER
jgi:hypothetical protein